jgi:hypothetical protein
LKKWINFLKESELYSSYLNESCDKVFMITKEIFDEFMNHMILKRDTNCHKRPSTMHNYWSSLKSHYTKNGLIVPPELQLSVSNYFAGLRNIAGPSESGKLNFTFDAYQFICELSVSVFVNANDIYNHNFTTNSWNLTSRSKNVGVISFEYMKWDNDCMILYYRSSKTDQSGEFSHIGRHIYCNPYNPVVCPLFSLGILILSNINTNCKDLFGVRHRSRKRTKETHIEIVYREWLKNTLQKISEQDQISK